MDDDALARAPDLNADVTDAPLDVPVPGVAVMHILNFLSIQEFVPSIRSARSWLNSGSLYELI